MAEKDRNKVRVTLPETFAASLKHLELATAIKLTNVFQDPVGHIHSNGFPVFRRMVVDRRRFAVYRGNPILVSHSYLSR